MISSARGRFSRVGVALFVGALAAFGPVGCSSPSSGPDGGTVEQLGPVPAPEGLLANAIVAAPDASWARARTAIGGPAAFLPQSFGGLVATMLGLPITVAGEVDGDVPAVAAIASPVGEGKNRLVAGVHVKVGDRFLDQLTKGEGARFTSALDAPTHIAMLTPKAGGKGLSLGVLGNYLLISAKDEDLKALGPYVARTMPALPRPKEDLAVDATDDALGGAGLARLKSSWASLKTQAEASGAPVLYAQRIDRVFDALADTAHARATLVLSDGAVHVKATMQPKPGGGPASKVLAELGTGDAKPLLDLPGSVQVALYAHAPATKDAADPAADLAALVAGKKASDADKETIAAALRAARDATGAYATLGVGLTGKGGEAYARIPVDDDAKAAKALQDVGELLKLPSVKSHLEEQQIVGTFGKTVVENLPGDVMRVHLVRKTPSATDADKKETATKDKGAAKNAKDKKADATDGRPALIDLLWMVQKGVVVAAVAEDAKDALRNVAKPPGEGSLGADLTVRAAIEGLGGDVSVGLLVDVPRLVAARVGKPAPPAASPLVFSFGKGGAQKSDLQLEVDVTNAALQELIRVRGAF